MSSISKKLIYLDNAAATQAGKKVIEEVERSLKFYGNPSSFNDLGRAARKELDLARNNIGRRVGAKPEEIVFTSSGSEANNLAIFGSLNARKEPGEIITTPIEHPSVLKAMEVLVKRGWKVTYLKVDRVGLVDPGELKAGLNDKVVFVSIIYANNEIGTIQPVKKIANIIREFREGEKKPIFHIDACQAAGYLDINVNNLGVDMMTLNGSKIYGPRGAAILFVRKGLSVEPLIYGGDQEKGRRAGTENLPAIAGMAKAMSLINKNEGIKTMALREYFITKLNKSFPDTELNGPRGEDRLANNINISFPGLNSENILLELDKYGVYASSGSACTARSVEPSHVLKAIGVEDKYLAGAIRFSLGRQTTKKDINKVLKILSKVIKDLRKRYAN